MASNRKKSLIRETKETNIELSLDLDGRGMQSKIDTSVPFFDHMLTHITTHGNIDININAKGDIDIDHHHLVEDIGITLAKVLRDILGDFSGINRYGHFTLPMDEALVTVALDFSGRAFLRYDVNNLPEKVGEFDSELSKEFFRAVSVNVPMTIHVLVHHGENGHHILEGIFKCFGKALQMATGINPKLKKGEIPSSKGVI